MSVDIYPIYFIIIFIILNSFIQFSWSIFATHNTHNTTDQTTLILNPTDVLPRKFIDEDMILERQLNHCKHTCKTEAQTLDEKATKCIQEVQDTLQDISRRLESTTNDILHVHSTQLDRQQDALQRPLLSLNQKMKDVQRRQAVVVESVERMKDILLTVENECDKPVTLLTVVLFIVRSFFFFFIDVFMSVFGFDWETTKKKV